MLPPLRRVSRSPRRLRGTGCATGLLVLGLLGPACASGSDTTVAGVRSEPAEEFALLETTPTPTADAAEQTESTEQTESSVAADASVPGPTPSSDVAGTPRTPATEVTAEAASEATDALATPLPPGAIELLRPIVIDSYPHDIAAYTQGLEIYQGMLLESTGNAGHPGSGSKFESDLRLVDIESGEIAAVVDVPGSVFAEGLTRVDDELVQITWQDQRVFWYDADTLELVREDTYDGLGWGLCYDGERLVMTDGSPTMYFRDPTTFAVLDQVVVTMSGEPLARMNELECVDGKVWGNIYQTDWVVRVEPATGIVDGLVDAAALERPRVAPTEVLNGIAWDAETSTWLMTGKFWPTMYRVEFERVGIR